uniref:Uncharacterized protein n=1 Tax=Arundo donax TaxID=35708 RepID=A0A0A8ZCB0_ARUDO
MYTTMRIAISLHHICQNLTKRLNWEENLRGLQAAETKNGYSKLSQHTWNQKCHCHVTPATSRAMVTMSSSLRSQISTHNKIEYKFFSRTPTHHLSSQLHEVSIRLMFKQMQSLQASLCSILRVFATEGKSGS